MWKLSTHLIPVMLAQADTETKFGPLFEDWTADQIQDGCRHMSFILINSKNYSNATDQDLSARKIAPMDVNFVDKRCFDLERNVYLFDFTRFGAKAHQRRRACQLITTSTISTETNSRADSSRIKRA